MDINTLRGLSTVFVMFAFLGVCWWAYAPKRKSRFDEAAQLPFADEDKPDKTRNEATSTEKEQSTL